MDVFSALADPTRRSIMELLADNGELPASAIYDHFPVSRPAISQHLKVLRDTDLVRVEKKAQQRLYRMNPKPLTELEEWTKKISREWNDRFDRLEKLIEKMKKEGR